MLAILAHGFIPCTFLQTIQLKTYTCTQTSGQMHWMNLALFTAHYNNLSVTRLERVCGCVCPPLRWDGILGQLR